MALPFNFCIIIPGLPLYDPSKDFTCLDGSKQLSFSNVNDDYCDCDDGSDEPGNLSIDVEPGISTVIQIFGTLVQIVCWHVNSWSPIIHHI